MTLGSRNKFKYKLVPPQVEQFFTEEIRLCDERVKVVLLLKTKFIFFFHLQYVSPANTDMDPQAQQHTHTHTHIDDCVRVSIMDPLSHTHNTLTHARTHRHTCTHTCTHAHTHTHAHTCTHTRTHTCTHTHTQAHTPPLWPCCSCERTYHGPSHTRTYTQGKPSAAAPAG